MNAIAVYCRVLRQGLPAPALAQLRGGQLADVHVATRQVRRSCLLGHGHRVTSCRRMDSSIRKLPHHSRDLGMIPRVRAWTTFGGCLVVKLGTMQARDGASAGCEIAPLLCLNGLLPRETFLCLLSC